MYTTTTSRTVPGLGALAGKGILAFGKLALRGLETVVIRQKLAAFKRLFPHDDNYAHFEHLKEVYDEILELTRCVNGREFPPLNTNSLRPDLCCMGTELDGKLFDS